MEESCPLSSLELLWLGGDGEGIIVAKEKGNLLKYLLLFHWN